MPTNKLNDAKCKAAKPDEKDYKLFDGGGLFLWVSPKGGKIWRMAYRFDSKPKTISFGPYPEVSLAEARAKRDEEKANLREGIDPMASRKADSSDALKFKEAALTYWDGRKDISKSYQANVTRALEMHVFPKLGDTCISSITREDLMEPLKIMDASRLYVYVRKVRIWASQVFEWAIANGHAKKNPAAEIDSEKAFGRAEVQSFAAVELHEVPELMQRLALENKSLQSVLACKFMALTWVRTKELRNMRWADIDFEEKVWRIPLGTMKKRRDHLVPLSKQAIEILEIMHARSRGSEYVFCAEHRLDRPISENAVTALLYRMGYKGIMTGHGWRSIASTWGNENEYNEDAIERQLSHVPKNKTRAVYNRAKYWDTRKNMLQHWGDWLDQATQIDLSSTQRGKFPAFGTIG